jgi:uncharacterized protein
LRQSRDFRNLHQSAGEKCGRLAGVFTGLGFSINEQFSNDTAIAVTLGPSAAAMLLEEAFFKTFTAKPLANAHETTAALVAIQLANREAVDAMTRKAIATGGFFAREPQDMGFMYACAFADIDGHIWEPFWMDDQEQHE